MPITQINNAIALVTSLVKTKSDYDNAHLKQELLVLVDSLHDAKAEIRKLEDAIYDKDKLLKELQESIDKSDETTGYLGARYYLDENGEPTGNPFCSTCWAKSKKTIPLSISPINDTLHRCAECGASVSDRQSPFNVTEYIRRNREAATRMNIEFEIALHK